MFYVKAVLMNGFRRLIMLDGKIGFQFCIVTGNQYIDYPYAKEI